MVVLRLSAQICEVRSGSFDAPGEHHTHDGEPRSEPQAGSWQNHENYFSSQRSKLR
jgi:hypothetical protein